MKSGQIKAVHDDDIVELLKSLGVHDTVVNGQANCHFCRQTVSLDDISAVFPYQGEVAYCCSSTGCYRELLEMGEFDVTP